MRLLVVVCVAVLSAVAFTAGSAWGATVTCKTLVYRNGPVYVTSARAVSCAAAAKEQRRYKWTGKNTFRTPGGFSCTPSGRGAIGYQMRCVKNSLAYRIEFAD